MTQIKIIIRNGRRAAFYKPLNSGHWFHMSVAEALQDLRQGKAVAA